MASIYKLTTIFTLSLEGLLIVYYFYVLIPQYNKTHFQIPKLEQGSTPKCSMFATHIEAQQFFNVYKDSIKNVLQLDNDNDGLVCENLP